MTSVQPYAGHRSLEDLSMDDAHIDRSLEALQQHKTGAPRAHPCGQRERPTRAPTPPRVGRVLDPLMRRACPAAPRRHARACTRAAC